MKITVHDSTGGMLVSSIEARGSRRKKKSKRTKRRNPAAMGYPLTSLDVTHDEAAGHAFHGNQWVEVAPGVHAPKSIVNHPQYTKEKFLKYKEQGKTNAQISNILSAHKYHAAKKAGTHVPTKAVGAAKPEAKAEPAPEAPKAVEAPKEEVMPHNAHELPKSEPSTTESVLKTIGFAMPNKPATPHQGKAISKAEADVIYAKSMDHGMEAISELSKIAGTSEKAAEQVAQSFKDMKAAQMAAWKANTTGVTVQPMHQSVYKADHELVKQLAAGTPHKDALAAWKSNTAKEKAGTWPPPSPEALAAKAAQAEADLKAHEELKAKMHAQQLAALAAQEKLDAEKKAAQAAAMATAYAAHPPAFPTIADYAPSGSGHGIHHDDFLSGKFSEEITELKARLGEGHPDAVTNKIGVQKALENKMLGSPAFQALIAQRKANASYSASLEAQLVSAWAGSSGGNNPISNAMQLSIRDAFGMKNEHLAFDALKVFKAQGEEGTFKSAAEMLNVKYDTPDQKATVKAAMRDFAHAQWANTQEHFKQLGIEHVYVARGMDSTGGIAASSDAQHGKARFQPASSFSANFGTAHSFSHGHNIFMAKVPVSQVLSTYVTGYGCSNEHEVVVLAHPDTEAVLVKTSNAPSLPSAVSHVKSTLKMGPSASSTAVGEMYAAKAAKAQHAMNLKHAKGLAAPPKKPKQAKTTYAINAAAAAKKGDFDAVKEIKAKYDAQYGSYGDNKPTGMYLASLMNHFEELPGKKAAAESALAKVKADAKAAKKAAGTSLPKDAPLSTAAYHQAMEAGHAPDPTPQEKAKALLAKEGVSIDPPGFGAPTAFSKPSPKVIHIHAGMGTTIPAHIASHAHFSPEKYEAWVKAGKTHAQISNNLSALKYHAEKKAGLWKPKKAA